MKKVTKLGENPMMSAEKLRLALLSKRAPKDKNGKLIKVAPKHELNDQAALYLALKDRKSRKG